MIEKKNILVAPLDWGLGHATRCIPIIKKLIANNVLLLEIDRRGMLVKKEFLEPFRGTKGGYRLKKGLDNISIRQLIEAIEGPVLLTDCLNKNANDCNLFNVCNTKYIWNFVNTEINNTLENIKIKDIKSKKFNYQ